MNQQQTSAQLLAGIALLGGAHILFVVAIGLLVLLSFFLGLVGGVGFVFLLFNIGVFQFLYAVPLCVWLRKKNKSNMRNGVIIGSVLTLLLNGSCYLYLFTGG
ncbi:MAG: hypothetical protein AB8B99_05545 [Phormidesmis sp.]